MSHTTETLHVHGIRRDTLVRAVTARMKELGFGRDFSADPASRTGSLRKLIVRRDRKWLTMVDADGFDRRRNEALPEAHIDAWGEHLSRALDRSVLTIWTWDGEATVNVTRWKRGKSIGGVSLLEQAVRGGDGFAYAPAKFLRPWLAEKHRDAILKNGIKLVTPSGGSTGDDDLDAMLEDFDDSDRLESTDDELSTPYVSLGVSVSAITRAVGMYEPFLTPDVFDDGEARKGDQELVFRR